MTVYCTLKRGPYDSCQQAVYEIVHTTATLVTLQLAYPSWADPAVTFSVGRSQIADQWEEPLVLPEVDTDAHDWANEIVDEEWRKQ